MNSDDDKSDISNPSRSLFGGDFLVLALKGNLTIILLSVDDEVPEDVVPSICEGVDVCSSGLEDTKGIGDGEDIIGDKRGALEQDDSLLFSLAFLAARCLLFFSLSFVFISSLYFSSINLFSVFLTFSFIL